MTQGNSKCVRGVDVIQDPRIVRRIPVRERRRRWRLYIFLPRDVFLFSLFFCGKWSKMPATWHTIQTDQGHTGKKGRFFSIFLLLRQDYYITLKLGCADRSFYEMSAVVEFHKSPFLFTLVTRFGPF